MPDHINHGNHVYSGGCHCGAVRFRFFADAVLDVLQCNCSICQRSGYLHVTVPHTAFELLTSPTALSTYRFGTGKAEHCFCATCGIKSFYQPRSHPNCYSVNLRCVDDQPASRITEFDGQEWEKAASALAPSVLQSGTDSAAS